MIRINNIDPCIQLRKQFRHVEFQFCRTGKTHVDERQIQLSLLNAAAQVLAASREPMNCKELVAKAVEMGLWTPTGAKPPEQTLYSGIFREIKSTDEPRFKKSETRKGSFEYAK